MRLVFCFAGRTFKGPLAELVADYATRIGRMLPCEIIEPKRLRLQRREGLHIVLSPGGREMNSEDFAAFIEEHLGHATRHLFFYVGPPEGFETDMERSADLTLALSRMTMNHQLIRVVLLEQVYRALTIIRHEPYHK